MTNIGITGQRVLSDDQEIANLVNRALQRIVRVYPAPYTLYSTLAQSSEVQAAYTILQLVETRLVVYPIVPDVHFLNDLPLYMRDTYLDLVRRGSEIIRIPPNSAREASKEAAGEYILAHTDVLIAVWDGEPAEAPGSAAWMVAEARLRRIPIAWVHTGNSGQNPRVKTDNPTFENFPPDTTPPADK